MSQSAAHPCMHAGPQADVSCDAGQQSISAASILADAADAVVLRMQQGQRWADEPFTLSVLGLIRTIREPETRFQIAAQPRCLAAF